MSTRRPSGRFTAIGLGLIMALLLMLPIGVAAATPVGAGESTIFAGNGFTPNDSLSFWETGPDNNPIPLGGAQTDGSGGFSFPVTFPSAGNWQVTAHSITTGKEITGAYTVGSTTASPTTTTSNVLPPGTLSSGIGAPVAFTGSGFTAGEHISIWETAPDSTVTNLAGTQADSNGAFNVSVSFPTAGNWQVTAKGTTSGVQVIGSYAVGTTGVTTSPVTAPVSSTTSGPLPPGTLAAGVGSPVTFSGRGFTAGEHIGLWETAPDSSVTPLAGTQADSTGAFNVSVSFPTAGNWQVTAQGVTSRVQVIGRYAVGTTDATSSSFAPTTGGQGFSTVPPVTLGAPVTFSGSGFTNGETIALWETAPDSTVTPLSDVAADSSGRFTAAVTFPNVGNWQITAHGKTSLYEVIGRYTITSDGTGTIPSPVTYPTTSSGVTNTTATTGTVTTTTNTTISFVPTGYTAGEFISVWSTGPDGSVTTLDSVQASSTGQATITAAFASAGLWQITAQGRTSGRTVVGRYQVTG